MSEFVMIPDSEARTLELRLEKARARRQRYEDKNPGRKNRNERRGNHDIKPQDREFIIWDGEGPQDTAYSLLGNSKGMEICYPTLSTEDCLKLIIETEALYPESIHIIFGGNYDASNIFKDLPWRKLNALRKYNKCRWGAYELEHIPHKWFKVKAFGHTARIFDVQSFFGGSLVSALTDWKIGPWRVNTTNVLGDSESTVFPVPTIADIQNLTDMEVVEKFKNVRSEFLWKDIEAIRYYMRLELKYTKILMEKLRQAFLDAGYLPKFWHGPGALAREALRKHNVYDAMATTPVDVRNAARYAFAGGRFQYARCGHIQARIYTKDWNSAYPFAATRLPNLSRGEWKYTRTFEQGSFGVWEVRYSGKPDTFGLYPLFHRDKHGNVTWPYRTEGWYWTPEAELVANDPAATISGGWVFIEDDPTDRPFSWIHDYYNRRQLLKKLGSAAEYTFKIIMNAAYGQAAQRTGWDRKNKKPPKSHQLEWAGYITSYCRAGVYRLAKACGDKLISIDTDGITSMAPIPAPPEGDGINLGEWKSEEFDDGIFWQSGVYTLKQGDKWVKAKSRGLPRGKAYTTKILLEAIKTLEPLELERKVFIGYGLALQGQFHKLNTWETAPYVLEFGGSGKSRHFKETCSSVCSGSVHKLGMLQTNFGPFSDIRSNPHYLPWLDNEEEMSRTKDLIDSVTMYTEEELFELRNYENNLYAA